MSARELAAAMAILRQAVAIANRAVIEDIESYCVKMQADGRIWWDTRPMLDPREHSNQSIDMATQAIRYALSSDLVFEHPTLPHLLSIHGRN